MTRRVRLCRQRKPTYGAAHLSSPSQPSRTAHPPRGGPSQVTNRPPPPQMAPQFSLPHSPSRCVPPEASRSAAGWRNPSGTAPSNDHFIPDPSGRSGSGTLLLTEAPGAQPSQPARSAPTQTPPKPSAPSIPPKPNSKAQPKPSTATLPTPQPAKPPTSHRASPTTAPAPSRSPSPSPSSYRKPSRPPS